MEGIDPMYPYTFNEVNDEYEIVVVGAGPAGLSVASQLSSEHRVLVIDSRPEMPRGDARLVAHTATGNDPDSPSHRRVTRSWFSPHDCLYDNPDLLKCRKPHGVTRFLARTYSGPTGNRPEEYDLCWEAKQFPHVPLQDRYPYLDEYKLIAHWEQQILESKNRSRIMSGHYYQDHRAEPYHVDVRFLVGDSHDYESRVFRARLLLDASGHDSDIRKAYGNGPGHVYWWSVFGAICRHPEGEIVTQPTPGHPLVMGDYMLWQTFASSNVAPQTPVREGRPIFEYEILDERTSFPLILYLRPYKIGLDRAKAEFLQILRKEPGCSAFRNAEIEEFKYGHYPSGRKFQSYAEDRVDFIGDAGLWTTPCGWGASFILKNYAPYARRLSHLMKTDQLDRASLRGLAGRHTKEAEFFMNTAVTRFLSYGTVEQLDQFIAVFRDIDPLVCERIFTLRAEPDDLIMFLRAARKRVGLLSLLRQMPVAERSYMLADAAQAAVQFGKERLMKRAGREPERGFGVFTQR
ncbi:NAD(P)-binding protein [Streptomyces sp. NPDC007117]|uniref:NAD(P)-binding protein n=1 Tax=unclassified Streptomyces TaxID=2593676 RepID=UPI0034031357